MGQWDNKPCYRCTPCDQEFQPNPVYKTCPLCGGETWLTKTEAQVDLPSAPQVKAMQEQRAFEQRLAQEHEADLAAARKIGRSLTPTQIIRMIEQAKVVLKDLPVANRFAIPPEERCPEYEARDNPTPARPWRPPSQEETQDA